MKLKNIGDVIVNIGKVIILPGEIADVTDKAYQNNAVIEHLIKTNRLALMKEGKEKPKQSAIKPPKAPEAPNAAGTKGDNNEAPNAAGTEGDNNEDGNTEASKTAGTKSKQGQ